MGKKLIQQRRGRATLTFRAPSHRYLGKLSYRNFDDKEQNVVSGKVVDIAHSVGHNVPIAVVEYETGERVLLPACEGMLVGQTVSSGVNAGIAEGNTLPLGKVPEGAAVYNIELQPGDGGRIIHSSGGYGYVVSQEQTTVTVRLPSGQVKIFNPNCRATLGVAAGAGRTEKPMMKAGKMHYKMHARNRKWPRSSANARNPVDHPFGGGTHQHTSGATVSHSTPPGRKVGNIAARRTGRPR